MSRYVQEAPRPFSGFQYAVDTFPAQSTGQFRGPDDLEWSNVGASSGLNPRTDTLDMNPAVTGSVYHDARGDLMNWRRVVQHQLQWDWMSTIVLPMQHVDSARALRWDVITYLPHMASPVPEESAPGLVTQVYSSSEAVMERIGMGLKEEHSAMNTVQGRQDTREKVKSVAVAVSKHIQVRGLYALLNSKTVYYQKQLQIGALGLSHGGPVRPMQYRDLLQREKDNFGAVQKEGKQGSLRLLQEARTIMGSYSVTPNTVIKTQMSDFYEGVTQMQKVAINFEGTNPGEKFRREIDVRTIVGVDMIKLVTTPVEIRSDWPAIDPLSRNVSNGSYVPQYDADWSSMDHYESRDLTIERYDETHDALQPLTLNRAVTVARRFDQTGALSREHQGLADDLNQGAPGPQPGIPMDDAAYFREQRRKVFGSDDGSLPAASASPSEDQEFGVDPRKLRDMFLFWTHVPGSQDGNYRVCSVIGDMEIPFLSHEQSEAAGRSFANHMGLKDNAIALAGFQDGQALMREIDASEPSTVYLEAVRAANLGAINLRDVRGFFANTDKAGTKTDGTTPADRILAGASFYRTLALPNGLNGGGNPVAGFPSLPFGYANYRGMRYLASFKGKASAAATGAWDPKIFDRAAALMAAFDVMYARVRDATNSPYFWPEMNFTYNAQEFSSDIENSKNAFFDALLKTPGGAIWFVSDGKKASDVAALSADDLPGATWNAQYKASLEEMLGFVGYGDRFDVKGSNQLKNALTLIFDQIVKPLAGPYGLNPRALKTFTDANIRDKIKNHDQFGRSEANKLSYTDVREVLQAALEKSRQEEDQKVAPLDSKNTALAATWIITPLTHPVHSRYVDTNPDQRDRVVAFTDLDKIGVLTPALDATNQGRYPNTQYNRFGRPSGFLRTSTQTGAITRNPLDLPMFTGTLGVQQPTGAEAVPTSHHMDEDEDLDFPSSSQYGLGLPTASSSRRSREESGLVSLVPSAKRSRLTQTGARTRTGLNISPDSYEPESRDFPFYGVDSRKNLDVTDPEGTGFVAVGGSLFSSQNMRKRFAVAERISDPLIRLGTHLWLSTRITRQAFLDLDKHNIRLPFHMLYFAFNQRRKTHSWIVLRSGSETGISAWNNALWETGDDVRTQVRFATFTVYVACVVHNDTNVMVIRDIWMAQYLGGNGDTFCLDYGDYSAVGDHKADLIAVMEPPTRTSWNVDINLTGQHTLGAVPQELYARLGKNQPQHYSSAAYYRRIYGNFNPRMSNSMVDPYASSSDRNNVVCVRDYYRKFNRNTRQYEISDNQGHCGATYVGVAKMRAGAPYAFPVLVTGDNTRRQLELVANN